MCLFYYLQIGVDTAKDSAYLALAKEFLYQPFFDNLRTKQRIGK